MQEQEPPHPQPQPLQLVTPSVIIGFTDSPAFSARVSSVVGSLKSAENKLVKSSAVVSSVVVASAISEPANTLSSIVALSVAPSITVSWVI